ncbi:MAG: hypothetical protein ACOC1X_03915 [Promethearchaeota archaeon]
MEKLVKLLNYDRTDREFRPYREQLSCLYGGVFGGKSWQKINLKVSTRNRGVKNANQLK